MNGIVVFAYATWSARYPELAAYVPQPTAQLFFNEATLYCDNTATSPITDSSVGGQREMLLYMLTSHIIALNANLGAAPSPLVGRIASANQGSVSVSVENNYAPGSAQWFQQSKYGSAFWAATKQFRKFLYVHGCKRNMDAYAPWSR